MGCFLPRKAPRGHTYAESVTALQTARGPHAWRRASWSCLLRKEEFPCLAFPWEAAAFHKMIRTYRSQSQPGGGKWARSPQQIILTMEKKKKKNVLEPFPELIVEKKKTSFFSFS